MANTTKADPDFQADARYVDIEQPNVPILDSAEVQRVMAQLQAERDTALAAVQAAEAKAAAAEHRLSNVTDIPHGVAYPEIADDFVESDDTDSFPQLNQLNSKDVVQNAVRAGKINYQRSHVTHRNEVPFDHRGGQATTVWMYDEGGWARRVQKQSVDSARAAGLYPTCPRCNGWHKSSETNPNVCPNQRPVKYTQCSICAQAGLVRYIWDLQDKLPLDADGLEVGTVNNDPNFIGAMDMPSTPEQRLKVKLEAHIKVYHPATAASMRLIPTNDM